MSISKLQKEIDELEYTKRKLKAIKESSKAILNISKKYGVPDTAIKEALGEL